MGYDFASPAIDDGNAAVLRKYKGKKGKHLLKISEYGVERSHETSRGAYRIIERGDALRFTRSKIFKNWRNVSVLRNGKKILRYDTYEDWGMLVMAMLLAVPGLSFFIPVSRPAPTWITARKLEILVVVSVIEVLVLLFYAVFFFRGLQPGLTG